MTQQEIYYGSYDCQGWLLPGAAGVPLPGYLAILLLFVGFWLLAPWLLQGMGHLLAPGLRRLAGVEIVATYDTAGSARLIQERQLVTTAAIASERAAEIYGLTILQARIQDFEDNITRFLIVGRAKPGDDATQPPDANKTTIVFSLPNEPGALFVALSVFALRDIDLTKLESRPIPGRPWEYMFYADLAAGGHELRCGRALTHLAEFARSLRTLGSYRAFTREKGRRQARPFRSPGEARPSRRVGTDVRRRLADHARLVLRREPPRRRLGQDEKALRRARPLHRLSRGSRLPAPRAARRARGGKHIPTWRPGTSRARRG